MREVFEQFTLWSVIDILLIAVVIYHVLLLIKGTKTAQILTGIVVIFGIFLASSIFPLTTLNWVMNKFYSSIILIIVVLFQDDIRHGLSRIGKKPLLSAADHIASDHIIDELVRAAGSLASKYIGALIVIERQIILSRYIDVGTLIEGRISKELLLSIFHPTSPIHDGAVIIQQGKIAAAGCFLPLTRETDLEKHMGTRHRAAIGISQETDSLVILISEERGTISFAAEGHIQLCQEKDQLRQLLRRMLIEEQKIPFAPNKEKRT